MKRMTMMLAVSGVRDLLTGSYRGQIDQIDQISFKRFEWFLFGMDLGCFVSNDKSKYDENLNIFERLGFLNKS